ncbi:MAG: ABC transporter permease subunit [Bacteroidetes bacterium]|nr:ABC transporter permease subunit [Bacteroidota bacterium]
MHKIIKYVVIDIIRNRIVLGYTFFLLLISLSVFSLEDNTAKGLLTLLNLILFIVPLVSVIFSTIYTYNSAEFVELLLSQPLQRKTIWLSLFSGLASSLCTAFLVGAGIPILLYETSLTGIMLVLCGMLLTAIFVSIAMLAAVYTRDKAKGIGVAILLWIYFALVFDGLILFLLFQFSDYPVEKPLMMLSFLNPIDLTRILILLRLDISALMGYTGAVFKMFMGSSVGLILSFVSLCLWTMIPLILSVRKFNRKDL